MRGARERDLSGGFTLLEVLIAITILSFIMAIVYSSFSAVTETERRAGEAFEMEERGGNLLRMMTAEISSVFLPPSEQGGDREGRLSYGFSCRNEEGLQRLDFTADLSDEGGTERSTLREIGYRLVPDEAGGYRFFKRLDLAPDEDFQAGGSDLYLMDGVDSLRLEFMKKGEDWKEDWEAASAPALPDAVRIAVSLKGENGETADFETEIALYLGKSF